MSAVKTALGNAKASQQHTVRNAPKFQRIGTHCHQQSAIRRKSDTWSRYRKPTVLCPIRNAPYLHATGKGGLITARDQPLTVRGESQLSHSIAVTRAQRMK